MLVNFWYISNTLQGNSINIYQVLNAFGDIPKFMKLEGGTYIFCLSRSVNVENICEKFGYAIQGNPIPVMIDSDKYNSRHKVSENFSLILRNLDV